MKNEEMEVVRDLVGGYFNDTEAPGFNNGILAGLIGIDFGEEASNVYWEIMSKCGIIPSVGDDYYFNLHSSEKKLSKTFMRAVGYRIGELNPVTGYLNQDLQNYIVYLFDSRFRNKYVRLLEVINADYSPIENYDRYEDLQKDYSEEGGGTEGITGSNTGSVTTNSGVQGYNGNDFADSDQTIRTDNLANSSDVESTNSKEGSETNVNHIHGNIGVMTADAMISGYIDTWEKVNVLDMLCDDIDKIITINTY